MLHANADGAISSHMVSHKSARIPRRYGAEAGIDIGDKFLHRKVFPVSGYRRIHKPRSSQWSRHIHRDKDEAANCTSRDCAVEQSLCAALIEKRSISIHWAREKVENRIALRRSVIPCRQIHHQLAIGAYANLVPLKVLRMNHSLCNLALAPIVLSDCGNRTQKERAENGYKLFISRLHAATFRWRVPIVLHEPQATMRAGARTSSACTCRPKPTSAQSWLLPSSALSYGTNEHDVVPARHRPQLVAETRARTDARERCPETEAHRRGTGSRTECRSPIVSSQRVTPPQIRSSMPMTA